MALEKYSVRGRNGTASVSESRARSAMQLGFDWAEAVAEDGGVFEVGAEGIGLAAGDAAVVAHGGVGNDFVLGVGVGDAEEGVWHERLGPVPLVPELGGVG